MKKWASRLLKKKKNISNDLVIKTLIILVKVDFSVEPPSPV